MFADAQRMCVGLIEIAFGVAGESQQRLDFRIQGKAAAVVEINHAT